MARSQNFKVGLLVILATVLLVVSVTVITGIRLRKPTDQYSVRFRESVSGLDPGSAVKFRGVQVGTVDHLLIPDDDISSVEVWIAVDRGTPIKGSTRAKISSVGITGLKFVDLIGGKQDDPSLAPGARIESEVSVIESLTGRAVTAAEKADVLLDNLLLLTSQEQYKSEVRVLYKEVLAAVQQMNELMHVMTGAASHLDTLLANSNAVVVDNRERIDSSLVQLEGALTELHATLADLNNEQLVENLNATVASARVVATDLRTVIGGSRRDLAEALVNLRETSANLNDFSRMVRDKPSLLLRSSSPEPRRVPDSE